MPPIYIEMMLVCFFSADPEDYFGHIRWDAQVSRDVRRFLRDEGLITEDYEATQKGRAWVKAICDTPLPVESYIIPARPKMEYAP